MPFRVCTDCNTHHIENCPDCYGFGFYKTKEYGVINYSSAESIRLHKEEGQTTPCTTCGSTVTGYLEKEMKQPINEVFAFWDDWIKKNLPEVGTLKFNKNLHWQLINEYGKEVNFFPSTGVIYVANKFSTKGQRLSVQEQQQLLIKEFLGEENENIN